MDVLTRCRKLRYQRIAFIGATKHAGKTTAMNGCIADAAVAGANVGLCSIGVDGEKYDAINGAEKPSIFAPAGSILVSAERALDQSEAGLQWLEVLPIDSPLGAVVAARVLQPGSVMLAGVRQRLHVDLAVAKLRQYGAEYVFVDGAFDRVAAAAPTLVDAAVLAVGAVAGKTEDDVAKAAFPFIHRHLVPTVAPLLQSDFATAHDTHKIAWRDTEGRTVYCDAARALFGMTNHPDWSDEVHALYLPGAVTDSVLQGLLGHARPLTVVAAHPAQLLIGAGTYRSWYRAGHALSVYTPMPVAAIAVNPYSITGYALPKKSLMSAIRTVAGDIPVYDALEVEELEL